MKEEEEDEEKGKYVILRVFEFKQHMSTVIFFN